MQRPSPTFYVDDGNTQQQDEEEQMPTHTHQTAPTQFVEANGIRFAYRRFGKAGGVPLVFNQHFTGTMDHWDPAVTDGFAKDREVILFDNAGVSSSSGEVPTTIEDMAANAVAFTNALGLKTVDVLGFSIGGFVAQEMTLQAPNLVRRLVLLVPVRAGVKRWLPSRLKRSRSSAPPMRSPIISGSRAFSLPRRQAKLQAANSSSAFGFAPRTATLR
jgi:pimeloyl-ACP methyl ester carboxylesterase